MTPERTARLVAGWVRLLTRALPTQVARRRVDEVDADLHDHIAHERAHGTADHRIALSILSRMLRGLPADVSWRRRVRPRRGPSMNRLLATLALAVLVTAIGVAAIVAGEGDDSPGLQFLGVLFVLGAVVVGARTVRRSR